MAAGIARHCHCADRGPGPIVSVWSDKDGAFLVLAGDALYVSTDDLKSFKRFAMPAGVSGFSSIRSTSIPLICRCRRARTVTSSTVWTRTIRRKSSARLRRLSSRWIFHATSALPQNPGTSDPSSVPRCNRAVLPRGNPCRTLSVPRHRQGGTDAIRCRQEARQGACPEGRPRPQCRARAGQGTARVLHLPRPRRR